MTGIWIAAASEGMPAVPESTRGTTSAPSQNTLQQVTIQARREAIAPRLHAFVNEALYLENDEAPARWNTPVCPSVAGLPRDKGEFVVARLSQIARAAGVPLAGEQCSPVNLLVVVTADPRSFLTKWINRNHKRIFDNGTTPKEISTIIDATVPVSRSVMALLRLCIRVQTRRRSRCGSGAVYVQVKAVEFAGHTLCTIQRAHACLTCARQLRQKRAITRHA